MNPSPLNGPVILQFGTMSEVIGSPYFQGGKGTELDPFLLHVPGCLQAILHVKDIPFHVRFIDVTLWEPFPCEAVAPPTAPLAPATLPPPCVPGAPECKGALLCVHDIPPTGGVSVQDFQLNHGLRLLESEDATIKVIQTVWKPIAAAGCLGNIGPGSSVLIRGVVWRGIDCDSTIRNANLRLEATELSAAASWCDLRVDSILPIGPQLPSESLPLPPSLNPLTVAAPVLSTAGLPPAWIDYNFDLLWKRNLAAQKTALERFQNAPAFPSPTGTVQQTLLSFEDNANFEAYSSFLTGAFKAVQAVGSKAVLVGSTVGCSAWGVIADQSPVTSLRSKFTSVAIPYLLSDSADLGDQPWNGMTVPTSPTSPLPAGPGNAFRSMCDIFERSHPATIISDTDVTLYGSNFADGFPVHASTAIRDAHLYGGMPNVVAIPDNVALKGAIHEPAGQGTGNCLGGTDLVRSPINPVTTPFLPGSCDLSNYAQYLPGCHQDSDCDRGDPEVCDNESPIGGWGPTLPGEEFPEDPTVDKGAICETIYYTMGYVAADCQECLPPINWGEGPPPPTPDCEVVFPLPDVDFGASPSTLSIGPFSPPIPVVGCGTKPPFPFYALLDGNGNPRCAGSVAVLGLTNFPLVAPDLRSIHYLLLAPPTLLTGAEMGFYNFMLESTATAASFPHSFYLGTAKNGYGFDTGVPFTPNRVKYYFSEESLPQLCVSCGTLPTPGSVVLGTTAPVNALTECIAGVIGPPLQPLVDVQVQLDRAPTSCGHEGFGTKGAAHHFRYNNTALDYEVKRDAPRRTPITLLHDGNTDESVQLLLGASDASKTMSLTYNGTSVVGVSIYAHAEMQCLTSATHSLTMGGKLQSMLTVAFQNTPFVDPGLRIPIATSATNTSAPFYAPSHMAALGCPSFSQAPSIESMTLDTRIMDLFDSSMATLVAGPFVGGQPYVLTAHKDDELWGGTFGFMQPTDLVVDLLKLENSAFPGPIVVTARMQPVEQKFKLVMEGDLPSSHLMLNVTEGILRDVSISVTTSGFVFDVFFGLIETIEAAWNEAGDADLYLATPANPDAYAGPYTLSGHVFLLNKTSTPLHPVITGRAELVFSDLLGHIALHAMVRSEASVALDFKSQQSDPYEVYFHYDRQGEDPKDGSPIDEYMEADLTILTSPEKKDWRFQAVTYADGQMYQASFVGPPVGDYRVEGRFKGFDFHVEGLYLSTFSLANFRDYEVHYQTPLDPAIYTLGNGRVMVLVNSGDLDLDVRVENITGSKNLVFNTLRHNGESNVILDSLQTEPFQVRGHAKMASPELDLRLRTLDFYPDATGVMNATFFSRSHAGELYRLTVLNGYIGAYGLSLEGEMNPGDRLSVDASGLYLTYLKASTAVGMDSNYVLKMPTQDEAYVLGDGYLKLVVDSTVAVDALISDITDYKHINVVQTVEGPVTVRIDSEQDEAFNVTATIRPDPSKPADYIQVVPLEVIPEGTSAIVRAHYTPRDGEAPSVVELTTQTGDIRTYGVKGSFGSVPFSIEGIFLDWATVRLGGNFSASVHMPIRTELYNQTTGFITSTYGALPTLEARLYNITGEKLIELRAYKDSGVAAYIDSHQHMPFELDLLARVSETDVTQRIELSGVEFWPDTTDRHTSNFTYSSADGVEYRVLAGAIGNWSAKIKLDVDDSSLDGEFSGRYMDSLRIHPETTTTAEPRPHFELAYSTPDSDDIVYSGGNAFIEAKAAGILNPSKIDLPNATAPLDFQLVLIQAPDAPSPGGSSSSCPSVDPAPYTVTAAFPLRATATGAIQWGVLVDPTKGETSMTMTDGSLDKKWDLTVDSEEFVARASGDYLSGLSFVSDPVQTFTYRFPEGADGVPVGEHSLLNFYYHDKNVILGCDGVETVDITADGLNSITFSRTDQLVTAIDVNLDSPDSYPATLPPALARKPQVDAHILVVEENRGELDYLPLDFRIERESGSQAEYNFYVEVSWADAVDAACTGISPEEIQNCILVFAPAPACAAAGCAWDYQYNVYDVYVNEEDPPSRHGDDFGLDDVPDLYVGAVHHGHDGD